MGFVGEGVEVGQGDGVDFVVGVEAFYVGSVGGENCVDKVVDGCWMGEMLGWVGGLEG